MILAQVETASVGGISDFAGKFGFPALLVMVLLYGIYKLLERATTERKERDEREDKKEEARRAEREADRAAHISALGQNTASLGSLGAIVQRVENKVDALASKVEADVIRLVSKGG